MGVETLCNTALNTNLACNHSQIQAAWQSQLDAVWQLTTEYTCSTSGAPLVLHVRRHCRGSSCLCLMPHLATAHLSMFPIAAEMSWVSNAKGQGQLMALGHGEVPGN